SIWMIQEDIMTDLASVSQTVRDATGESDTGWRPGEFVLRNAWFAVAHCPEISSRPVLRIVHSQQYRIWRGEDGKVHASTGRPETGEVFNTNVSVPAPVHERFGHVWVWFGNFDDADPELIPDIPFLAFDAVPPEYARGFNYFHSTYELVLENILDL